MPRKKIIPTEPLSDPPTEITEATMEPVAAPIEQPPPDILAGSAPPGETWGFHLRHQKLTPKPK